MNFDFLKKYSELSDLYNYCNQAEVFVTQFPDASVRSARNGLECAVKLFYVTKYGRYSETSDLFGLIEDYKFKSYVEGLSLLLFIMFVKWETWQAMQNLSIIAWPCSACILFTTLSARY